MSFADPGGTAIGDVEAAALSPGICGYGTVAGLFCHTAEDECASDDACFGAGLGNLCLFEPAEQRWKCTEQAFCE